MSGAARRVCLYSVASHLAGAERSLLDLARGLHLAPQLGFRPWVLVPSAEGPLPEALSRAGVPWRAMEMPEAVLRLSRAGLARSFESVGTGSGAGVLGASKAALAVFKDLAWAGPEAGRYLAAVSRELASSGTALLHTNGIKCHVLGWMAAAPRGIPVLWHLRDWLDAGPVASGLRALHALPGVHAVANSRATAEAFKPGGRGIAVVHNGLSAAEWQPRRHGRLRERAGAAPDELLVGIVGMLARWKGQEVFLDAAARLAARGVRARFAVIGGEIYDTGADRGWGDELRRRASELGLGDRVLFTGLVGDPADAMNGLDVLVHASTRPEPFGRVIVEAMACGVPVVAAAAGGVLEIVRDADTGLLYRAGDADALAGALELLLRDEPRRRELARRGRAEFLERFTIPRHVEGVAEVYREVLG